MKQQLFNRDGKRELMTDDAKAIDEVMRNALKPMFKMWFEEGYSVRDLRAVGFDVVNDLMLDCLLGLIFNDNY